MIASAFIKLITLGETCTNQGDHEMKKSMSLAAGLSTALLLACAGTAANAAEEWEFSLAPLFLWGMSIEGDSTIEGNTAPLDLDFRDDVLENLEAVFTLHFEARRGDWGFFAEYQYADLQTDVGVTQGPITVEADIGLEDTLMEFGVAYAFSNKPRTRWEALMGARYLDQDITIEGQLSSPLPPLNGNRDIDGGDSWWNGFGGVRVFHSLTDNWTFVGRTDYGYGGSDNSTFNIIGLFDYRFRDWGSFFGGYRHMEYDYESSSYAFDAKKRGPVIGLNLYW